MTLEIIRTATDPRYLSKLQPDSPCGDITQLAATAELLNRPLRDWQTQLVTVAYAANDNRWRYQLVVYSVPRQAGKTTLDFIVAIDRCLNVDGAQVVYTAQSRIDAANRLADMVRLLDASPLRRWQGLHAPRKDKDRGTWDYRATMGIGSESISFPNGSTIAIFTPREDSLHGSVTDLVIIDEARFFPAILGQQLMAAALPTQVTRDGQIWVSSTAGGPESTWLQSLMEAGRASVDDPRRSCYGEWSIADDIDDGDLLDAVWTAHPAAGLEGGPQLQAVEFAAETMPAWQFAHEYGNRWHAGEGNRLISPQRWEATYTSVAPGGALTFAADVAPDRNAAAIVVCGGSVLEVIKAETGVDWVADELRRLVEKWETNAVVIDSGGPAVTIAELLRDELGEKLIEPKTREFVAACGSFFDRLATGSVQHRPHTALDEAISHAARRATGGSWVFARANGGHLVTAAALAQWGEVHGTEKEGWFVA